MMNYIIVFFIFFLLQTTSAFAKITIDTSQHIVHISGNFKGTSITAFGVCDYDEDIIILLKGGESSFSVRKMAKKYKIWSTDSVIRFDNVPDIYTIYSNKKVENILSAEDVDVLKLNIKDLPIVEKINYRTDMLFLYESFNALIKDRKDSKLLNEYTYSINRVDNSNLFQVKIDIPDKIKAGSYEIIAYSVKNKKITNIVAMPLSIKKTGINGTLYYLVKSKAKIYAILCVTWSMFIGWSLNYIIQAIEERVKKTQ